MGYVGLHIEVDLCIVDNLYGATRLPRCDRCPNEKADYLPGQL